MDADGYLEAVLLVSPHASAAIVSKSSLAAIGVDGLVAVFFDEDLNEGSQGSYFAGKKVEYFGQPVALVVGRDRMSCCEGLEKIDIKYHAAPGILDVAHAKAVRNLLDEQCCLKRGNPERGLDEAEILIEGSISISGQYPMACGILMAEAEPLPEGQGIRVSVPAERPSDVRISVAEVTGLPESLVRVEGMSMAGSSGGRGRESVRVASLAAVAAMKLGSPVRLELDASQEAALTGRRHAVEAGFRVACDKSGVISALDVDLVMDAGAEGGHARAVLEQAILNVDGAYGIADFRVNGRLCRTNGLTGASILAEGAAQGIFVMEDVIARIARRLGKTADTIRELNFYRSGKTLAETPYGQKVDADLLSRLWIASLSASKLHERREAIGKWNQKNSACKRGIAAVPIKMGVGDPVATNNQAAACVQLHKDGSVKVSISKVDVADGLLTRVRKQVSDLFGVQEQRIAVDSSMDGSLGSSLQAYLVDAEALIQAAVQNACIELKHRLESCSDSDEGENKSFAEQAARACQQGESLVALGYSKQTGLGWDGESFKGSPFSGYFYGTGVIEVELDAFTGDVRVLRADLFCQGGETENADLDRAQISRAYMMGQGWVLNEDVNSHCYAVPGLDEAPLDFRIELIDLECGRDKGQQRISCAEAPLTMAAALREALKEAIFAYAPGSVIDFDLPLPAGQMEVMRALREISKKAAALKQKKKKSGGAA